MHLEGPYSNQALLSAGWAYASAENYERALVPWNLLVERDVTDSAVQEAKLALPFAYGKLNVYGRAAVLYDKALVSFGEELEKVIKELPRDKEVVDLYQKMAGADPLPAR